MSKRGNQRRRDSKSELLCTHSGVFSRYLVKQFCSCGNWEKWPLQCHFCQNASQGPDVNPCPTCAAHQSLKEHDTSASLTGQEQYCMKSSTILSAPSCQKTLHTSMRLRYTAITPQHHACVQFVISVLSFPAECKVCLKALPSIGSPLVSAVFLLK